MLSIKRRDYLISLIIVFFTILLILFITSKFFLDFSNNNLLFSGFIKFFFLATIGDIIGSRIRFHKWAKPNHLLIKATIWGFIGIVIVLMFNIFSNGTTYLQSINVLPFAGSSLAFAFFTSLLMNFTFAPTMMMFHRITDTYLELRLNNKNVSLKEIIDYVNWNQFFKFIILRTVPLFWLPAHTITFLLPSEYRIVFAAILGILLGVILALFKGETNNEY